MRLTPYKCPDCGAPLRSDDVDHRLAVARCHHCRNVFSIERDPPPGEMSQETVLYAEIGLPAGMEIDESAGAIEIRYRWMNWTYVFMLFFCLFWNGFMLVWHTLALASGAWGMSLFGLIHTGVGLYLAYWTLAGFLNTATIRADRVVVEASIGPIPWPGSMTIDAAEITQFYCQEHVSHGKNGVSTTYSVDMLLTSGIGKKLMGSFQTLQQARFVEQELERFLRIQNQPVHGEAGLNQASRAG